MPRRRGGLMVGIWSTPVRCPKCPNCEVELLPQVTLESLGTNPFGSWTPDDGEFWCPSCEAEFGPKVEPTTATGAGFIFQVEATEAVPLRPRETTGSFKLRVERDGLVSLSVNGAVPIHLTMAQMHALSSVAIWLGRGAQTRQEHLRGADRWVFSTSGGEHSVTHLDETRKLERYRVGNVKGGTSCWGCHRRIGVGSLAYRPIVKAWESSRVRWRDARFCAACAESGTEAQVRGPLRLIAGGKG